MYGPGSTPDHVTVSQTDQREIVFEETKNAENICKTSSKTASYV